MIRILFLIDGITGGGAEKALCNLVNNMDHREFEITVQTLWEADPAGYLAPAIRYKAINRCKTAWGKWLFHLWVRLCAAVGWLYPLYIRGDYDIEVAYLECGATKFLAGSANKRAKKVAWLHCDPEKRPDLLQQARKLKKQYEKFQRVVCVSDGVKAGFDRYFGTAPSRVIHNVVDPEEIRRKAKAFPVEREDVPTFMTVGRLSPEKGVDRLVDACAMLKSAGLPFRVWILGDGKERSALEAQVRQLGLENEVMFLGFRENPYPYLRRADVLVSPSRQEGFSTVVTEALILGKPVVSTPSCGMEELLGCSEFGLVTPDSARGLYEGMKEMAQNSALRAHYEKQAAIRGAAFTLEEGIRETEAFFRELLTKA